MLKMQNAEEFLKELGWVSPYPGMWCHEKLQEIGDLLMNAMSLDEAVAYEFERMN